MFSEFNLLVGLIVALLFAVYAFTKRALTETGTLAAIVAGLMLFAYGGWYWFVLMALFFASSTLLTRYKAKKKERVSREFEKGGVRDFWQVATNALVPAALALAFYLHPNPWFYAAFAASVAAVNSDTWATELGVLSKKKPVLLTTGKPVPKGTSGAVSGLGLGVAFAGALAIAVAGALLAQANYGLESAFNPAAAVPQDALLFVAIVTLAGFLGCLVDSAVGALAQRMYWCSKCRKFTERPVHACGRKTGFARGFKWVDNDVVNFASAAAAALLVLALAYV
ncbi:MAG: DUF92 domain-containing protein [Candidatus Micrarchaeia archaeon]